MLTDNATVFRTAFTAGARQLAGHDFPDQWVKIADRFAEKGETITGADAAEWANLGYTPAEAAAEMDRGITLDDARYIEEQLRRRPAAHVWRNGKRLV